ncbi:hypothetical protein DFH28DRAFT_877630, partial [Melampsora americana]
ILRADSEAEDAIIHAKSKTKAKVTDTQADLVKLREYFGPPFREGNDNRQMPPLSYPCRFCHRNEHKPVRVSYTNMTGQLKIHRDGSTQEGRSDAGCSGQNQAKHNKPELCIPPSVREARQAAQRAGPLDNYVVATSNVVYNNSILNKMACAWLIRHAQPWSRIEDPLLQGMVRYLRKDAHLNGRWWAADEVKKINVSLKDSVFAELKVRVFIWF